MEIKLNSVYETVINYINNTKDNDISYLLFGAYLPVNDGIYNAINMVEYAYRFIGWEDLPNHESDYAENLISWSYIVAARKLEGEFPPYSAVISELKALISKLEELGLNFESKREEVDKIKKMEG